MPNTDILDDEDILEDPSNKPIDELIEEQDFDPEEEEYLGDEDESIFPSLLDKR